MGFAILTPEYYIRWYNPMDESGHGLSDDNIQFAYELLENAGFLRSIFYDRTPAPSEQEFISWAKSSNKLFFMLFCTDGTPFGLCWLTDPSPTGHQSYAHFATFNLIPVEKSVKGGRELLKFICATTSVKQAVGITPRILRGAVQFAMDIGFKKLAIMEKMLWCMGKKRDAILSLCELTEL